MSGPPSRRAIRNHRKLGSSNSAKNMAASPLNIKDMADRSSKPGRTRERIISTPKAAATNCARRLRRGGPRSSSLGPRHPSVAAPYRAVAFCSDCPPGVRSICIHPDTGTSDSLPACARSHTAWLVGQYSTIVCCHARERVLVSTPPAITPIIYIMLSTRIRNHSSRSAGSSSVRRVVC